MSELLALPLPELPPLDAKMDAKKRKDMPIVEPKTRKVGKGAVLKKPASKVVGTLVDEQRPADEGQGFDVGFRGGPLGL